MGDLVTGSGLLDDDDLSEKGLLLVRSGNGRLVLGELLLDVLLAKSDLAVRGRLLGGPLLAVHPKLPALAADRSGDGEADNHEGNGEREAGEVVGRRLEDVGVEREGGVEKAEGDELGEEPRAEGGGEVGLVELGRDRRGSGGDDDAATEELGEARARLDDLEVDGSGGRVLLDVVLVVETVASGDL